MNTVTPEIDRIHRRLNELLRSDPTGPTVAYYRALADLLTPARCWRRCRWTRHGAGAPGSRPAAVGRCAARFRRAAAEDFFRQVCRMLQPYQPAPRLSPPRWMRAPRSAQPVGDFTAGRPASWKTPGVEPLTLRWCLNTPCAPLCAPGHSGWRAWWTGDWQRGNMPGVRQPPAAGRAA